MARRDDPLHARRRLPVRGPGARAPAVFGDRRAVEVLHPRRPSRSCTRDKYESCDSPIAVPGRRFPRLPGFDRPKASDVMGELVVRAWLETALPAGDCRARRCRLGRRSRGPLRPRRRRPRPRATAPDGGTAPTAKPAAGLADDLGRRRRSGRLRARRRRRPPAAPNSRRAAARRSPPFLGAPELAPAALEGMLDGWKASSGREVRAQTRHSRFTSDDAGPRTGPERCSPTTRSSDRLSTS